jgi:hypothetical protein
MGNWNTHMGSYRSRASETAELSLGDKSLLPDGSGSKSEVFLFDHLGPLA